MTLTVLDWVIVVATSPRPAKRLYRTSGYGRRTWTILESLHGR